MNTYIIYNDSGTIKGMNSTTGKIDFSSADISTILKSINSELSRGETVIIRSGVYTPGSAVTFTKSIKLIGEGNVIFNWNIKNQDLFRFNGTELGTTTITSDVNVATNTIAVVSVGTAIVGDLILIYDDSIWNPTDYPVWKTGELHEISSISGNTFTITDITINSFTISNNGSVKIIKPVTTIVDNIKINGADRTAAYYGIGLLYNKDSIIRNCILTNNGLREIYVDNSYHTIVDNNIISNSMYPGYGYGVSVSNTSANTLIIKNKIQDCGHCVTLGGTGTIGQTRDTIVISNILSKSSGETVLDSHNIAESYYIYDNVIYCNPGTSPGVSSGAKINIIIGNKIYGGTGCTVRGSVAPNIWKIENNVFTDSQYCFNNIANGTFANPTYVSIQNNIITGIAGGICYITAATSYNISGNIFDTSNGNTWTVGNVIQLVTCTNGIICNNWIKNAYSEAINLKKSSNYNIISGNRLQNWDNSGSGGFGIDITDSSYNLVSGNFLSRSTGSQRYGIGEYGTSDYNNIYNNDVSQVGNFKIYQNIPANSIHSKIWKNIGYITENDVLSSPFAIDSTGIKTVTIPHGLAITPNIQDCYLTIVQNTAVDDWTYNLLKVVSTDVTNVITKINVSKVSATVGATAKLAMRIGNP